MIVFKAAQKIGECVTSLVEMHSCAEHAEKHLRSGLYSIPRHERYIFYENLIRSHGGNVFLDVNYLNFSHKSFQYYVGFTLTSPKT